MMGGSGNCSCNPGYTSGGVHPCKGDTCTNGYYAAIVSTGPPTTYVYASLDTLEGDAHKHCRIRSSHATARGHARDHTHTTPDAIYTPRASHTAHRTLHQVRMLGVSVQLQRDQEVFQRRLQLRPKGRGHLYVQVQGWLHQRQQRRLSGVQKQRRNM